MFEINVMTVFLLLGLFLFVKIATGTQGRALVGGVDVC